MPFNCSAVVPLRVAPAIVPVAVIFVALAIAPVFDIPPLLLLTPPVMDAPPAETVNAPAEVMVPVPVVEILPEVESTPFSLMVNLFTPLDSIASEVLGVPPFVSLITNALPVP